MKALSYTHRIVRCLTATALFLTAAMAGAHDDSPPPPPAPDHDTVPLDFITAGGWFQIQPGAVGTVSGGRANFGWHGGVKNGAWWGNGNYVDHAVDLHVRSTRVTGYVLVGEDGRDRRNRPTGTRDICGTATTDRYGDVRYRVRMTDNGEPGRQDTFAIALASQSSGVVVYRAEGALGDPTPGGGNVQLHKGNRSNVAPAEAPDCSPFSAGGGDGGDDGSAGAFSDDFNRSDSPNLGNSWIEKNANAFSIEGSAVAKASTALSYRDNLAYRPASEDLRDVEASVELRVTNASSPGFPQIHVRVQSDTVADAGTLDGYILYINDDASRAVLGRQRGRSFVTGLRTVSLSSPLNTSDRFRLRLMATGTNPVRLVASVERRSGGSWQVIGQESFDDTSAERIATAGSVGFGGSTNNTYVYDNFTRQPNP